MRPTPDKMSTFLAQLKKKMNLKSLVVTLAAIVVFTTTYLLILPAFTLDQEEAMEQGGIDVVAVETAADTDQAEEAVEEEVAEPEETAEPVVETGKAETAAEAEKSDKSESDAKPAVKLLTKQKIITAEQAKGDDFEVSAVVDGSAKVPADVTITATELNKETEDFDYAQYKKDALAALKKDSSDVKGIKSIKFYDISLESESQEDSVKPEAPVNVKIAYEDGMKVDDKDNVRIVHFAEQKNGEVKAEVLDKKENNVEASVDKKESKLTEASFDAEGFSVYAVAEIETLKENVITADGESFNIEVSYGPEAGIPAGAKLKATEIKEGTKEYQKYIDLYKEAYAKENEGTEAADEQEKDSFEEDVTLARFFDIQILVNGEKFEPDAPVQVSIKYDDAIQLKDNEQIKAVHFAEDGTELISVDVAGNDEGITDVTFTQGSFSITGYVVQRLETNWPSAGEYVVILQKGDNYYALKNDGEITSVTYDSITRKVVFEDLTSMDETEGYMWTVSNTNNTARKTLSSGSNYLDPDDDNDAISTTSRVLRRNNDGNIFYRSGSGYYTTDHYLGINENMLHSIGDAGTNDRVSVLFANNFSVDVIPDPVPSGDDVDLGAPTTSKTLTSNGDGTSTISLSVTGKSQASSKHTKADVLVIVDTSGSMTNSRMTSAKNALRGLAEELLSNNTAENPDTVRLKMMTFSSETRVRTENNQTFGYYPDFAWVTGSGSGSSFNNGYSTFDGQVEQLATSGTGGTNWEDALDDANDIEMREDAEKYVIFVSDGNPTFRNTQTIQGQNWTDRRTDFYYSKYGLWGTGSDSQTVNYVAPATTISHCYQLARIQAKEIVDAGKNFYTIAVFDNVGRMKNLTAYAYTGSDDGTAWDNSHYQSASNQEALNEAFAKIVSDIRKNFAYEDVVIDDGITDMTTSAMVHGSVQQITYKITDKNGNDITATEKPKIPDATYNSETNLVEWNMGKYRLLDGATYTISFVVWPSQEAYDLVAELNNHMVSYDSLSPEIQAQIQDNGGYYSLKTNTRATVGYSQVTTTTIDGQPTEVVTPKDPIVIPPPNPLSLVDTTLVLKKEWNDSLSPQELLDLLTQNLADGIETQVVIKVHESTEHGDVLVKTSDAPDGNFVFTPAMEVVDGKVIEAEWPAYELSIAPGVMVSAEKAHATGVDQLGYPTIVYNNTTYYIIETGHDYTLEELPFDYHFETNVKPYHPMVVDGNLRNVIFKKNTDGDITGIEAIDTVNLNSFVVTNDLKGGINLYKHVISDEEDENSLIYPDDEFTIKGKLLDSDGNPYTFNQAWDPREDKSTKGPEDDPVWQAHQNDPGAFHIYDRDGNRIGYKIHVDNTADFTVTLKAGEYIRFINMPSGTTWEFEEINIPTGYQLSGYSHGLTGTVAANTANDCEFFNYQNSAEVELYKYIEGTGTRDENNNWTTLPTPLDNATFELYGADENGEKGALIKTLDPTADGLVSLGELLVGNTYYLTEKIAPAGYNPLTHDVKLVVTADGADYYLYPDKPAEKAVREERDGKIVTTIYVPNSAGEELPVTGGIGTTIFYILGSLLVVGCGIMLVSRRRTNAKK